MYCILAAYREKEAAQLEKDKALAILAGQVATTPYMKDNDRQRFWNSIEGERAPKEYTEEQLIALLNEAARQNGEQVYIETAHGKIFSTT